MSQDRDEQTKLANWDDYQYDRLEQIPRELRFFPSDSGRAKRLSSQQVDAYNRQGFVTGIRLFDTREAAEIRRYFDDLLERTLSAGKSSYSINTAHRKHRRVHEIATHSIVLDCMQDILGDDFVLWGAHFFCKLPSDGKEVAWHQDASYWPLTPSKTVTVWLAIDDADRSNGCMRVIPRSHLHGHLPWRPSGENEGNVLDQTVEDAESYGDPPVDIELRAGEASLHSDLLVHGSAANSSQRRRCGLTMRYAPVDVKAYLGWHEKGVVCRGEDPAGHWANYPPPEEE
jgi:hypothetical protein